MSTLDSKTNVATAHAIAAGASPKDLEIARQYMGQSKFIGYCQSFVRQVTGGRTQGASAIEAWNNAKQKVAGSVQGMQPGDLVYFSPNASNSGYGHTGIYAGQGQFVSATDKGIRQSGLSEWMQATGQKLLGYVPAAGRAVGNFMGGLGNDINNMFGGGQNSGQSSQITPQQAIQHHVQMRQAGQDTQVPVPMPPTTPPTPDSTPSIELDPKKMRPPQTQNV